LAWLLIFFAAIGHAVGQNQSSAESTPGLNTDGGKKVFGSKCATCHGLDGLGGEHAPDIVRRPAVKALSDQALLDLIHDGIQEEGMPAFPSLGKNDGEALIAYLRFLQGKSAGDALRGDPARGKDLFFGKASCSACHQIAGWGEFAAGDVGGFAREHPGDEILEAILRPAGRPEVAATVVARDGRKFSGTIRNEDNSSMQLQDGNGQFYLLMKSSLVSVQRKAGSSMPLDYGNRLSRAELDDLVAFILRQSRPAGSTSAPAENRDQNQKEEPHAEE
jgi:cytochrome c oxidase cbb3-type subunit 3